MLFFLSEEEKIFHILNAAVGKATKNGQQSGKMETVITEIN